MLNRVYLIVQLYAVLDDQSNGSLVWSEFLVLFGITGYVKSRRQ